MDRLGHRSSAWRDVDLVDVHRLLSYASKFLRYAHRRGRRQENGGGGALGSAQKQLENGRWQWWIPTAISFITKRWTTRRSAARTLRLPRPARQRASSAPPRPLRRPWPAAVPGRSREAKRGWRPVPRAQPTTLGSPVQRSAMSSCWMRCWSRTLPSSRASGRGGQPGT